MIRYNKKYFIISSEELKSETDLKIEVFPEIENTCLQNTNGLHKTNFEALYVKYFDGFDMITGFNRMPANQTEELIVEGSSRQGENHTIIRHSYTQGDERRHKNYDRFRAETKPFKLTDLNYDLHLNIKIDFVIHKTLTALRSSELELLKRDCEMQRTQLLTILMLAQLSDKMAGYLLT